MHMHICTRCTMYTCACRTAQNPCQKRASLMQHCMVAASRVDPIWPKLVFSATADCALHARCHDVRDCETRKIRLQATLEFHSRTARPSFLSSHTETWDGSTARVLVSCTSGWAAGSARLLTTSKGQGAVVSQRRPCRRLGSHRGRGPAYSCWQG